MLTLKIQNPEIETIFLEGFNSNKEMFFEFVKVNYNKMILLNSKRFRLYISFKTVI